MPRMYSARVALTLRMSSVTRFLAKVPSELSLPLLDHGHPCTFLFDRCNSVGHQTVQVGKLWQLLLSTVDVVVPHSVSLPVSSNGWLSIAMCASAGTARTAGVGSVGVHGSLGDGLWRMWGCGSCSGVAAVQGQWGDGIDSQAPSCL